MVFSSHPAFYFTNFQVHSGLNELHVMFLAFRGKLSFLFHLWDLTVGQFLFSSMLPTLLCCLPDTTDLCWSLHPWPVPVALPDLGASRGGANSPPFRRSSWSEHMKEAEIEKQPSSSLPSFPNFKKIESILYIHRVTCSQADLHCCQRDKLQHWIRKLQLTEIF